MAFSKLIAANGVIQKITSWIGVPRRGWHEEKKIRKDTIKMAKTKTALVNLVLPHSGDSKTTKAYRAALGQLGFNRWQQAGSVGGDIGPIDNSDGGCNQAKVT